MTNEELREFNRNRKIYQVAWVTRDLEKSMKAWVETLKVGPWRVYSFTDETVKNLHVGGKPVDEPFKFRIAISWIGDTEVEIIQPVYGPTIYQRFLDEKGEGLHHIKEQIADDRMEAVVEDYASPRHRGDPDRPVLQGLPLLPGHRAARRLHLRAWQLPGAGPAGRAVHRLPARDLLTAGRSVSAGWRRRPSRSSR